MDENKTKPVYAVISYYGNQWTVHYQCYELSDRSTVSNITTTGYGKFPYDRFPGIPVIDFTDNDNVIKSISIPLDDMPKEVNFHAKGSLESYLDTIRSFGIPVIS